MTLSSQERTRTTFWKKVKLKLRYGMIRQVIRKMIMRTGIEISPYYLFLEGETKCIIPAIKGDGSEFLVRVLLQEDMEGMRNDGSGFAPGDFLALLKAGQQCIGMIHQGGKIAAYMWINFLGISYKSFHMSLKSNEAYLWNMFTLEAYRGKNLAPYLRYKSYEILHDMGKDKLYSISEYFNTPAIRFKQKLNARIINFSLYIKLFKKFERNITLRSYI